MNPVNYLKRLFNSKDSEADSIVFGGIIAIFGLIILAGWDVIFLKNPFNAFTYSTGVGTILGSTGGAKTIRDRFSPQGNPPQLPDKQLPVEPEKVDDGQLSMFDGNAKKP